MNSENLGINQSELVLHKISDVSPGGRLMLTAHTEANDGACAGASCSIILHLWVPVVQEDLADRLVPVVRPYLEDQRHPVARWGLELARTRLKGKNAADKERIGNLHGRMIRYGRRLEGKAAFGGKVGEGMCQRRGAI